MVKKQPTRTTRAAAAAAAADAAESDAAPNDITDPPLADEEKAAPAVGCYVAVIGCITFHLPLLGCFY